MRTKTNRIIRVALLGVGATSALVGLASRPDSALSAAGQGSSGAQIFAQNCARCHGNDGEGDRGPSLVSEKRRAKWGSGNAKLIAKISKGGFLMPAFKKRLTQQQIATVADYVRSLP